MDKLFSCGTGTLIVNGKGCSLLAFSCDLAALFGYKDDLPLSVRTDFLTVIATGHQERFLQCFSQSVEPGTSVEQTVTAIRNDGVPIILYIYGTCTSLSSQQQVYDCIFMDATTLKGLNRQLLQADQRLEMLADTMQGGVVFYRYHSPFPPQFISRGMLALLECDTQQFSQLFQTSSPGNLAPEDWEWIFPPSPPAQGQAELREFSIVTCTGKTKWLMAARQLLQTEEDGLLVCITAWDITENARNIQQLETERQRYQLLCKYTQDLLYDYDLHRDILVLYGDMERVNGQKDYSLVVEDFLAMLPSSGIMAAEDAQKIHHICMGHYSAPTELRLRFPMDGEQYSWYRIRHGAVKRDASGRMIQILGILRNIDQSKRESEHLRALSEQDTFTGLLNKHSTNDAISQYLKEYGGEKSTLC